MNEGAKTVHVVFSPSAAGTLRKAFKLLGITEPVIGLPGSLSIGPIDPPNRDVRQSWGRSALHTGSMVPNELDGDPIEIEQTWAEATAPGVRPVFWACLSSPMEHACFLAFVARMDGEPFDIIDVTAFEFTTSEGIRRAWSIGAMRAQEIAASPLLEKRRPFSAAEFSAATVAWSQLRRENAPFRIVRDGRLVSAPLSHYDALLVAQASEDWEIAPRLIGRAMSELCRENALTGHGWGDSTSDVVLFGRMLALGENSSLRVLGPGPGMRDYQVCRPAA